MRANGLFSKLCLKQQHQPWGEDDTHGRSNSNIADGYVTLRVAHAPGMPETLSPSPTSRKTLVSNPEMHHGSCVKHVSWWMSGSLTRSGGKTFLAFPSHAQPAILHVSGKRHIITIQCHSPSIAFSWYLFWLAMQSSTNLKSTLTIGTNPETNIHYGG